MSELNFKPEAAVVREGERALAVPAVVSSTPASLGQRHGPGGRSLRRRFSAARREVDDSGFRLFRVY